MAQPLIQPSFNAGELAPSLNARIDLQKYHAGAAKMRNMFVDYRGGAASRPGTSFVGYVRDASQPNRLIPFVFSTLQAYALAFGHQNMQVVMNGALVIDHTTGLPFFLVTPWAGVDLALLKFTQSADVLTVTHPAYATYEITRTAHDAWTVTAVSFTSSSTAPTGVGAAFAVGGDGTHYRYVVTAIAANGITESVASAIADSGNSKTMSATAAEHITVSWVAVAGAQIYNVYRTAEVPTSSPAAGQLMGFVGSTTGTSFVDANIEPDFSRTPPQDFNPFPSAGNYPGCTTYYQQRQVYAATLNDPQELALSKSGDYKNFGYSSPARADDSIIATIAAQKVNAIKHLVPMQSLIALTSDGAYKIDGGSPEAAITPTSISVKVQSFNGCSDVRPLVVGNDMLYIQSKGAIVRDLSYNFYANTYTGNDLTPLANHLFNGHQIVDWAYAEEPYKIVWAVRDDGVLLSFTYVKEQEVYAWAHHDTKGKFRSVVSIPEGNEDAVYFIVERWIQGGILQFIERMASRNMGAIPEGVAADWTTVSHDPPVPVSAEPVPADLTRAWFVDAGLAYPLTYPNASLRPLARTADVSIASVLIPSGGAGYVAGDTITVTDSDGFGAVLMPTIAGGAITAVTVLQGGVKYSNPVLTVNSAAGSGAVLLAQLTRDVPILMQNIVSQAILVGDMLRVNNGWGIVRSVVDAGDGVSKRVTINVKRELSSEWIAYAGEWSCTTPVTRVTGLHHLTAEMVSILADGNVMPQQQVINDAITLQHAASAIVVGLPITAQLQSLNIDTGEVPTVQGKRKQIPAVTVRVQDSRGFKVGTDFDHLDEAKERDFQEMGEPILPYTGDRLVVIDSDWNVPGQVCVQQDNPLPLTVLGLIPQLVVGDTPE